MQPSLQVRRREMSKVTTNDLSFPYKIERKGIYLDRRWWD